MGYTTDFTGKIIIEPALNQETIDFLQKFNNTRRMQRGKGAYYVDNAGFAGQDKEDDIIDYNRPPAGQPSLWCQWTVTPDGTAIVWDGGEKFYESEQWMKYIIEHFLQPNPKAAHELEFLSKDGHTLNGVIEAQGEERSDRWNLVVEDNNVYVQNVHMTSSLGKKRAV